jgi:hypothetical protein
VQDGDDGDTYSTLSLAVGVSLLVFCLLVLLSLFVSPPFFVVRPFVVGGLVVSYKVKNATGAGWLATRTDHNRWTDYGPTDACSTNGIHRMGSLSAWAARGICRHTRG